MGEGRLRKGGSTSLANNADREFSTGALYITMGAPRFSFSVQ